MQGDTRHLGAIAEQRKGNAPVSSSDIKGETLKAKIDPNSPSVAKD
jgi:hypothetical protein